MTTVPRLTVGLPVFNGERYLAETLRSILTQDFEDIEVLVADNASTDATRDIVRDLAAFDSRLRLVESVTNRGAAWNYNRLVHETRSDLFKWAGYDDLLEPTYLTKCVQALEADPLAVIAYPETVIINADGLVVSPYQERVVVSQQSAVLRVANLARRLNLCNACMGVMRRRTMLQTGLIRPYISSDVTFLAEMAVMGTFARVDEPLFQRRVHEQSSRQGHIQIDAVAQWFDTSRSSAPIAPRLHLLLATVGALSTLPVGLQRRTMASATFAGVYALRRARISAGRFRATLAKREIARPEMIHALEELS